MLNANRGFFKAAGIFTIVLSFVFLVQLYGINLNHHLIYNWSSTITESLSIMATKMTKYPTPPAPTSVVIRSDGNVDHWKSIPATQFTPQQVIDYFYWTNSTSCRLSHDFGGKPFYSDLGTGLDGQKAVCLDAQVAPKAGKCLVYSFGIDNEWSFDDFMGHKTYGCHVYAFDPSLGLLDHNRSEKVHFYNLGLGAESYFEKSRTWTMSTLSDIYRKLLGHDGRIIDYLKMDVESSEWVVIPQMIADGMLAKVRQLGMEVHWNADATLETFRSYVAMLKSIEDAGMIRFDSKPNPWSAGLLPALNNHSGPSCFEIAWYQILPYN